MADRFVSGSIGSPESARSSDDSESPSRDGKLAFFSLNDFNFEFRSESHVANQPHYVWPEPILATSAASSLYAPQTGSSMATEHIARVAQSTTVCQVTSVDLVRRGHN